MDKIHELHAAEKYGNRKWIAPHYYDYPDGEDLIGKLRYTFKITFSASALTGVLSAYGSPSDTAGKFLRLARCVIPGVGMGLAFTCVTYYATKFRGKDDEWNYVLGGVAAGSVLAPTTGNVGLGIIGIILFPIIGALKKTAQLEGKKLIPTNIYPERYNSYFLRKIDTTLAPEIPGNWTKYPTNKK